MMRVRAGLITPGAALWFAAFAFGAAPQQPRAPSGEKGTLRIVVLDESNNPLSDTHVAIPGQRGTTGLDGSWRFKALPGRYAVLVSKPGYRGRRLNAGVRPGEETTVEVKLQKLSPALPPEK